LWCSFADISGQVAQDPLIVQLSERSYIRGSFPVFVGLFCVFVVLFCRHFWASCSRPFNRAAFREKLYTGLISRVCRSLLRDDTALVRICGAVFFGKKAQDASISHERAVRGVILVHLRSRVRCLFVVCAVCLIQTRLHASLKWIFV